MAGDAIRPGPFSEKDFYLEEFRGRSLAFALPPEALAAPEPVRAVLRELEGNGTRVVAISRKLEPLQALLDAPVLDAADPRLEGALWRALAKSGRAGIATGSRRPFEAACREIAQRLRVAKLVFVDPEGGLRRGKRLSFVDLDELRAQLAEPEGSLAPRRRALLQEVRAALEGGVPAVNVCTAEGLAEELFTYAGSGTLFTPGRYVQVRRLGLDDFDAAHDLLQRGIEEGYLVERPPEEIDRVLASGFGAFVEGRHLAGMGTLLVHEDERAGEIAALSTLTRFLGEGVGGHLVAYALERAGELELAWVFACTTAERAGALFERHGFRRAAPEHLPASKWRAYDPARRTRLRCYRRELPR